MSGSVSVIQVMGYWFGTWLSCNRTTFPIWKFLDVPFYLVLYCSVTKIPFLHLDQNSFSTWHHLLLEYKSGLLKFPGGGISTFDLMVDVLLGEIGIWLSASIMASTVACLELTTASTSPISVLRGSSSNILPCVLMKAANTWLADLICSQMSPIWLLAGGFLSYTIQSETFEEIAFIVLHPLESYQQFLFCSHKVPTIVRSYHPNFAPSSDVSSQSLYKGICLHTITNFKGNSSAS